MKNKLKLFFSTLILLIPSKALAFCTSNELQTYRGYARDIKIKYNLVNNDVEGGNFKLTFDNMNFQIYAKDRDTGTVYQRQDESNDKEIVSSNQLYQGGQTRVIEYYTISEFCPEEVIYKINLTLPKYNIYYGTDTCSGINNYEYCSRYIFTTLSNDAIKKKIDEYRKSHEISYEEDNNEFKITLPMIIGGGLALVTIIIFTIILINRYKRKKEEEW